MALGSRFIAVALGVVFSSATALAEAAFQPEVGQSVAFVPGGTTVNEGISDVDQIAAWVATFPPAGAVQILGYYCQDDILPNTTTDDLLQLAEQRAVRLKTLLVERGIDAERVTTIAYGNKPSASSCEAEVIPSVSVESVATRDGSWHWLERPVVGIGIAIGADENRIVVRSVVADSPAAFDGTLQEGDELLAVLSAEGGEWQPVAGLAVVEVVSLIRGPEDSVVGLKIQPRDGPVAEIYLNRAPIHLDAAASDSRSTTHD